MLETTSVGSFPKPDYLIKARNQFAKGELSPEKLYVSPSAGLEFLPHEAAVKKLHRMVEAVKNFQREFLIE